jgi:uncharacterized membrane protein
MFRYELLRNQWVMLALLGGIAIIAYIAIYVLDFSKERKQKKNHNKYGDQDLYETNYLTTWQGMPWSLKITIFIIVTLMTGYAVVLITNPQSW